jgi:magnesium transporter
MSTRGDKKITNCTDMSDQDGMVPDTGYDTPVPELDDHRHESNASPRQERPRRGTFDSLYGSCQVDTDAGPLTPDIRVRDFEEAIIDEDAQDIPHMARHSRRLTADTANEGRSVSPPNSVKAFAQARRRERDMSFSEPNREYEEGHGRALSISSRRSHRSRARTIEKDARSLLTDKAAEEDVCFPLQDDHRNHELQIDFDYLENFINTERAAVHMDSRQLPPSAFEDLRTHSASSHRHQMATADGDILDMPSDESVQEKRPIEVGSKPGTHPIESNRFSFFSSAWESTIHAAELGDLVLPGEDIRGLFELPKDETDGVWWLNVNRSSKEEAHGICKAFGVHPLTIEDIITQEAREKIELFPSYYFACFRSFNVVEEPDGIEYEPFNIYVLVFRQGTLSFSFAPNSHASQVRKRITALKEYVSLSSDWICYALM